MKDTPSVEIFAPSTDLKTERRHKITVYVPCFNVAWCIGRCLASILSQARRPDEVLVIDDGSTDATVQIAMRFGVTIVKHDKNRGLATARNTAVRLAKGDLVAALDADCIADPMWLHKLERVIASSPDVVGASGPLIETELRTVQDRWRDRHLPQHRGLDDFDNPPFLFGANTMYRKAALVKAGLYPVELKTHGEDLRISHAIYRRIPGCKLKYIGSATCFHLRRDTIKSLIRTYWKYQTTKSWTEAPGQSLRTTLTVSRKMCWHLTLCLGRDLKAGKLDGILIWALAMPYCVFLQLKQYRENRSIRVAVARETQRTDERGELAG